MPFIIADTLESGDYKHIELLNCSMNSGYDVESTVSVKVRVGNNIYKSSDSGNGGFDAFIKSIKKILEPDGFKFPELQDFEIRIPKGGHTNALTECFITWEDEMGRKFKTRGVHANQVFAGVNAAMSMLNMTIIQQNSAKHKSEFFKNRVENNS